MRFKDNLWLKLSILWAISPFIMYGLHWILGQDYLSTLFLNSKKSGVLWYFESSYENFVPTNGDEISSWYSLEMNSSDSATYEIGTIKTLGSPNNDFPSFRFELINNKNKIAILRSTFFGKDDQNYYKDWVDLPRPALSLVQKPGNIRIDFIKNEDKAISKVLRSITLADANSE